MQILVKGVNPTTKILTIQKLCNYIPSCSFSEPLVQKYIFLSPIFSVTGQPPQMHPFSSVMHLLFPIVWKQKPPFSSQATQLGQLLHIHMDKTICSFCSISFGSICSLSIILILNSIPSFQCALPLSQKYNPSRLFSM